MNRNLLALIPLLGMDGEVLNSHFPSNVLWESYPVIKRISLIRKDVNFPFLICLSNLDRCSCARHSIPDDEISLHSYSPLHLSLLTLFKRPLKHLEVPGWEYLPHLL